MKRFYPGVMSAFESLRFGLLEKEKQIQTLRQENAQAESTISDLALLMLDADYRVLLLENGISDMA